MGDQPPTPEGYAAAVHKLYGPNAVRVLALYPGGQTKEQVLDAAQTLATDAGMGCNMCIFGEEHRITSRKPIYRFFCMHPRPKFLGRTNQTPGVAGGVITTARGTSVTPTWRGAVHSAETEYALGNLFTNKHYAWGQDDYKLSEEVQNHFADFIKNGDPNGAGLPDWPSYAPDTGFKVMNLDIHSSAMPDGQQRYVLFNETLRKN